MSNFYLASDTFSKVRDEFEPIHRQLNQVIVRSQTDPAYFDNSDRQEPGQVRHRRVRAADGGQVGQGRAGGGADDGAGDATWATCSAIWSESQKLLDRIQHVMDGRGRVGIFPDLASQRTKSTEIMNQLVGTRQKFAGKIRAIIDPVLTPEEKQGAGPHRDRARRHRAAAVGDADDRRGRAGSTSAR